MSEEEKGLKAGTSDDYSESMAEAMENAFRIEWNKKGYPLPEIGQDERMLLFSAIAQGVVKHLVAKAGEAFQLNVVTTQLEGNRITSNNSTQEIDVTPKNIYDFYIDEGDALVIQEDDQENKVVSQGTPEIIEVKYKGTLY